MQFEFVRKVNINVDFPDEIENQYCKIAIKIRKIFAPVDVVDGKVDRATFHTLPYYGGYGHAGVYWHLTPYTSNFACKYLKIYFNYFIYDPLFNIEDLVYSKYLNLNFLTKMYNIFGIHLPNFWNDVYHKRILNRDILVTFKEIFIKYRYSTSSPNKKLFDQICNETRI